MRPNASIVSSPPFDILVASVDEKVVVRAKALSQSTRRSSTTILVRKLSHQQVVHIMIALDSRSSRKRSFRDLAAAKLPTERTNHHHPTVVRVRGRPITHRRLCLWARLRWWRLRFVPPASRSIAAVPLTIPFRLPMSPKAEMMHDGIPSRAFLEREAEFDIVTAPYVDLGDVGPRHCVSKMHGRGLSATLGAGSF